MPKIFRRREVVIIAARLTDRQKKKIVVDYLESGSLKNENQMLETQLVMENGAIRIPDTPGMGNDVREDYIRHYRVDL